MINHLISYVKKLFYLFVFTAFSLANAGSYDDFFRAIKQDNAGKVKELLARGFDANTTDLKGQSGLALAVNEPSPKATQVLLEWPKTDTNKLNAKGESALMMAAFKGNKDLVEKLIAKGSDVNKTGWTPLHYAATGGHIAIISILLESNSYIDAESPNGTTPLMMAAMYGTLAAVKLLLQEGADPKIKNRQGLTAVDFAQRGNRPDAVETIAATIRNKRLSGQW
jgi:ankyrin repeat protein